MQIDQNKCMGCHSCQSMCPVMAIKTTSDGKCEIDPTKCVSCGTCAAVCPLGAISK